MKVLWLTVLFVFSVNSRNSLEVASETSALSESVAELAVITAPGKFSSVNIFVSVLLEVNNKVDIFVTDFVKALGSNLKVLIWHRQAFIKTATGAGSLTVVIIDTQESFEIFQVKLLNASSNFDKFYLLVLVNGMFTEIGSVVRSFWISSIHHINVIVEEKNGTISLLTFYPFTSESCGNDSSLQLINQFNLKAFKWNSDNFYHEKFENLHNCTFLIGVIKHCEPSVIIKQSDRNETNYSGFEVDIFREIVKILNMNYKFKAFEEAGLISFNESTSNGSFQSLYERKIDGTLGKLSLQYDRSQVLSVTQSILSVPIVIVVPPPATISSFRKLLLPFTATVWIFFLLIFIMGFIVITVTRMRSKGAYNFLVGSDIQTPFLNMLDSLFGGSLHLLPSRNFARFVLMNFMLFCLVIRSLYQAKLFIMLEIDVKEKTLNTINDMMENQMTFFTYKTLSQRVKELTFANRQVKIIGSQTKTEIF